MTSPIDFHRYSDLLYDASKNNANAIPVHGHFEKLEILSDWGQSEVHNDIVQAFDEMDIVQIKPIQKNAFLYLMNKYNTAMVGFSKGKSTSYLASICSLILSDRSNSVCKSAIEPKAIIVSNSSESCFLLYNLSKQLTKYTKIMTVVAYSHTPVNHIIASLCNGCDIFITTPSNLIDLLSQTKIFSWLNLQHFVFDNLDILLDKYKDQIGSILNTLTQLKENKTDLQMISASVKWTKNMDTFLNHLFVKWQYIFGSHLEAARYMKIGFHVVHAKGDKFRQISEFLKNNIKCVRCVLISSNPNEIGIISKYISHDNSNIDVLLPGEMKCAKVPTIHKWNEPLEKSQRLLICSDNMLSDFYIDKADCLIHYDIPNEKHTFSIRFSVLQDSNNTFIKKDRSTYVFLSNSSEDILQLPKVVDIMKTFGDGKLDPILLKHAKMINDTLEKEKKNRLLCRELQQFGYCPKLKICQSRHFLLKEIEDSKVFIPKSGLAIVKILNVYDASYMSVKLLKLNCTNNLNDQHWSNVEDYSDSINLKLESFYSNDKLRIIHEKPKPGDMVAVQKTVEDRGRINTKYFRAVVINEIDYLTKKPLVSAKLIDEGIVENVEIWDVFVLPDVLKCIPSTAVDIFLASVKPAGLDNTWCHQANTRVKKLLKFAADCKDTIIVKIEMALGTTIWIKKLYKKYWNSKLKSYDFETLLPDILYNTALADKNVDHLPSLLKLCKLADIYTPSKDNNQKTTTIKPDNNQKKRELSLEEFMSLYGLPKPQWAHLDDQKDTSVTVDLIISPKMIFVRNYKHNKRVIDLLDKIGCYIKQNEVEKLKHIVKGAICLAEHPEMNRFSRAQIIEILDDTFVEILFVDIGDFCTIKSISLLTITPYLIVQLPFQVIECGLSGVKDIPSTGEEHEQLVDYFFTLTHNLLYIKVLNTISSAKFTGGNYYEVALYDDNIIVNFELHSKFSHYFDPTQLLELEYLMNNENNHDEDDIELHSKFSHYFDPTQLLELENLMNNENNHDEDDIDIDEDMGVVIENKAMLLNDFSRQCFGMDLKDILKIKSNLEYKEQENAETEQKITEITPDVTPVVTNNFSNDLNKVKPVGKIKSNNSTVSEKLCIVLNKDNLKQNKKLLHICLSCNNNTQSIVPKCYWYQDKNSIYLKLNILEIDDYTINCTVESITFNGQFKDVSYNFFAKLYGPIYEHNIICKRSYEGLYIKANKLYVTDIEWPQLFVCNKWHNYLMYDPEHLKTKEWDSDIWIGKINKYKKLALGTPLNEDIDDSESIDEIFDDGICEDT